MPPALVSRADIVEVGLDCRPIAPDAPRLNGERYIHCEMYKARSDVQSVIYTHDLAVIPFGLAGISLKPVVVQAGFLPLKTPLFEVRDANKNQEKRGMLVINADLGQALAKKLGSNPVILMRGHGDTVVGRSVREAPFARSTPTSMPRRRAPHWRSAGILGSWMPPSWRAMRQRISMPTGRGRITSRGYRPGGEWTRSLRLGGRSVAPALKQDGRHRKVAPVHSCLGIIARTRTSLGRIMRRKIIAALLACMAPLWIFHGAQAFPDRPVKLVVPSPPGGPPDIMARLIMDKMSAALGQPVIVENRPGGAGGLIGAKSVLSAEPDGYTVLMGSTSTVLTAPLIYKNPGYSAKSFAPVAGLSETAEVLTVNPSVAAHTRCRTGQPGEVAARDVEVSARQALARFRIWKANS